MKILNVVLALSISAIVFASCDNTFKKQDVVNPLVGHWKIDSIASADSNAIGLLILAMTLPSADSGKHDISFASDTVTLHLKDTVSKTAYHFNNANYEVLIHADSTILIYKNINDSMISLTAKDSTAIFLKKE